MFIISSFEIWADVVIILKGIQHVFVDNVGMSFLDKQIAFADTFTVLGSVQESVVPLEIFIGDLIVFWRVWVLCTGQRRLVVLPFAFLLATAACSLGILGCFAQNDWPIVDPPACGSLILSAYSLSAATNISGTIVIGLKVWYYRKNVGAYLGKHKRGRTEKILTLLLESGVVYSLLWIVQIIMVRTRPPATFSAEVVRQIFRVTIVQLVGIYPTLLVVLVYLQRSLWDASGHSTFVATSSTSKNAKENGADRSQSTLA
ncbi:hypothetical protein PQX77_019034 [Marasmius sp. AFHP31]|nr:hypothetical protein PQX77_019034 [Marasmius sp. AFHP31]